MAIKILILDDEREILNSMKRLLKLDERFEIYVTTSPEKALSLIKKENIQIAITDIVMPEMNGIEFLEQARKINGLLQVIMMTAYSSVDRVLACLEKGAADYIMKPFSNDELMEVLGGIVKRLERWRALVVAARGLKDKGMEVADTSRVSTSDSVEIITDEIENVEELEKKLSEWRGQFKHITEYAASIVDCIEKEERQIFRERLMLEVGDVLMTSPDEELLERLLISKDAFVRNAAISMARELREKIVPILERLLDSPDKDVRKLVLDIAAKLPIEEVEGLFLKGLDDPDTNIRMTAAEYLGAQQSERAVDRLEDMVLKEDEPMLLSTLLEALAAIGNSPRKQDIIERFRSGKDPVLVYSFLKYLGQFGDRDDFEWIVSKVETGEIHFSREVVDCLLYMMKRLDGLVLSQYMEDLVADDVTRAFNPLGAYQSLEVLYIANPKRALTLAREVVDSGDGAARIAAVQFLAEHGDQDDRKRLSELAEHTTDEDLQATILEALDQCNIE